MKERLSFVLVLMKKKCIFSCPLKGFMTPNSSVKYFFFSHFVAALDVCMRAAPIMSPRHFILGSHATSSYPPWDIFVCPKPHTE